MRGNEGTAGHKKQETRIHYLTRMDVYLKGTELPFTAVMPLSFANVGEEKAFCSLVASSPRR